MEAGAPGQGKAQLGSCMAGGRGAAAKEELGCVPGDCHCQ